MTTTNKIQIIIEAQDRMSKELAHVRNSQEQLNRSIGSARDVMKDATKVVASYMGAYEAYHQVREAVTAINEFGEKMAFVNTIARQSKAGLDDMGRQVREIKKEFAQLGTGTSEALYDIYSVLGDTGKNMDILKQSARAAVGGMVDVSVVGKSATGALYTMGIEAGKVNEVLDIQFKTLELGKMQYRDIAQYSGEFLAAAKDAGQDYSSIMAMYATVSKAIGNTAQSATGMRAALSQFKTADFEKNMKVLGISVADAKGNFKDFPTVLFELQKRIASFDQQTRAKTFEKLFPSEEARQAALGYLSDVDKAMSDHVEGTKHFAGAYEAAAKTMMDTDAFRTRKALANVENLRLAFGEKLAPAVAQAFGVMGAKLDEMEQSGALDEFAAKTGRAFENVIEYLGKLWEIVTKVYGFMGDNANLIKIIAVITGIAVALDKLLKTAALLKVTMLALGGQEVAMGFTTLAGSVSSLGLAFTSAHLAATGFAGAVAIALVAYTDWLNRDSAKKVAEAKADFEGGKVFVRQKEFRTKHASDYDTLRKLSSGKTAWEGIKDEQLPGLYAAAGDRAMFAKEFENTRDSMPDKKEQRTEYVYDEVTHSKVPMPTTVVTETGKQRADRLNAGLPATGLTGKQAEELMDRLGARMERKGMIVPVPTGTPGNREWQGLSSGSTSVDFFNAAGKALETVKAVVEKSAPATGGGGGVPSGLFGEGEGSGKGDARKAAVDALKAKAQKGRDLKGRQADFLPLYEEAAAYYGVPLDILLAVSKQESTFNARAKSPAGAMGLMQLMPGTAKSLGVKDPWDPRQNIMGGAKYLRDVNKQFKGNWDLTLAGYNWGPHRDSLKRGDMSKLPKETRNYIKSIKGSLAGELTSSGGSGDAIYDVVQQIEEDQKKQIEALGSSMNAMLSGLKNGYEMNRQIQGERIRYTQGDDAYARWQIKQDYQADKERLGPGGADVAKLKRDAALDAQTKAEAERRADLDKRRRDMGLEANAPDAFNLPKRKAELQDWLEAEREALGDSEDLNRLHKEKLQTLETEYVEWQKGQLGHYRQFTLEQLDRMVQDFATKEEEKLRIKEEIDRRIQAGEVGNSEAFMQGYKGAREAFESEQQKMLRIGRETADGLQSAFGDSFVAAFRGDIDSLGDIWDNFTRAMVDSFVRAQGEMMAQKLLGGDPGGGGMSGGGGGGGSDWMTALQIGMAVFGGGGGGGDAGLMSGGSAGGGSFAFAAKGGIFPGHLQKIRAFAAGGIATEPTLAIIREAGQNEAVVPLTDGRSIPVTMRGGGGGTVIHNHNHFQFQTDDAQSFIDRRGEIIQMIAAATARVVAPGAVAEDATNGGVMSSFFPT